MAKVNLNLSDNFVDLVNKFNDLSLDVGDLSKLDSDLTDSDVIGAINSLSLKVGKLSDLDSSLEDSDIVGAINFLKNILDSDFSDADIRSKFSVEMDSSSTGSSLLEYDSDRGRFTFYERRFSIINDSAGSPYHPSPGNLGLSYDSDSGILRFFQPDSDNPGSYIGGDAIDITGNIISVPDDGITRAKLSSEVELIIYNSSGTELKKMYGAGD